MRVVLDSNIFIFAFREEKAVCMRILENMDLFEVFIPSLILDEIVERLKTLVNKNFASKIRHTVLSSSIHIVDISTLPKNLIEKYEKKNLKTSDAVIAAFTEYIQADYLHSENRHFLKNLKTTKFGVKNAEQFLEMVGL
jgi:predicted nucleic acid-binding protein